MSKPYFRQVPDFDYVSRIEGSKQISNYIPVKNLFKRVKLRPDIYQNTAYFTKYTILGNERPDAVADKFYEDPTLDWIILLSNNILNIQTEWPMAQTQFDEWLIEKYGSYENLYSGVHHYETTEIVNSEGTVIIPAGLKVSEDYNVSYYDFITDSQEIASNFTVAITNYDYEVNIENKKREIYVLKADFLRIIFDDVEKLMPYKEGSSQYVTETLKKADNIRLYK
jgi:hypothetical protein